MLPTSSPAIPTSHTQRVAEEEDPEQPSMNSSRTSNLQDPLDDPGAQMSREARVWRTYVRETDRRDKEMVEGRNNSLDVLLIFAALFSAVSTAFIVESLGDLKPDPAGSSAQTLLVVSQTLAAISNGQPVTLQDPGMSDSATFSPSRASVVVNVLWLMSLSLSIAVSLVAMLAKEWCYKFMSRRSGQIYEQARRRQQRWNGIEKWKMAEVLAYLPGVMHLALWLFATGMCVYLWDINVNVATPVIVVSVSATLVYACATILPAVDDFCPYSTPATTAATRIIRELVVRIRASVPFTSHRFSKTRDPYGSTSNLGAPGSSLGSDPYGSGNAGVPMDSVSSQMIAWILTNCEDSHSIDTALQAIAGAGQNLPHEPLAPCSAVNMLIQRFNSCIHWDSHSGRYRVKNIAMLPMALGYCRAYSVLVCGGVLIPVRDTWATNMSEPQEPDEFYGTRLEHSNMIRAYADLIDSEATPGSSHL
ncbi:hypothetical protein FRC08_008234, partial [Ceratobasidium sp. 394]